MEPRTDTGERSPLLVLVGAVGLLGLLRAAARVWGLLALLGVVIACVLVLTLGTLALKLLLLH